MAQTGIDLNLFNILAEQQDREWTLEQLAEKTKAEPALLCMPFPHILHATS